MTELLEPFSVIHRVNGEAGEPGENSVFLSAQENEIPRRQADELQERRQGDRQTASCRKGSEETGKRAAGEGYFGWWSLRHQCMVVWYEHVAEALFTSRQPRRKETRERSHQLDMAFN